MTNYTPYELIGAERRGKFVITCDHASNIVPEDVGGGSLGLPAADMERHIAYDIGAEGVARALGEALEAPVILSRFSRLVIDPNRGEHDPTLLMRLYDGTIIPTNRHADAAELARRVAAYYLPYHRAISAVFAERPDAALISMHSYTPQLRGRPVRPWQVGVLSAHDRRLSEAVIDQLGQADFAAWVAETTGAALCIGDNQPYSGHLPGDSVDRHALQFNRQNTLIELRNDLIATEADQIAWATRLGPVITKALAAVESQS
ncbi:MAG: N-formylglutamate amidohydrolase [Mangrovicoccus sp.]